MFFLFNNTSRATPNLLVRREGVQQNVFLIACVLQNMKSHCFFSGPLLGNIVLMLTKILENIYVKTFANAKNGKQMTIFNG